MLWKVRHLWLSRSCFVFNCYRHWSLIVICNRNKVASILHSREVVTKGYPLYIIAYGLGVLLIIKNLKTEHHGVTQTRCDDCVGALGTFGNIEDCFNYLTQVGSEVGYYPDLKKSVLIFHMDNLEGCNFGRHVSRV